MTQERESLAVERSRIGNIEKDLNKKIFELQLDKEKLFASIEQVKKA